MIKKIMCTLLACAFVALLASCSCCGSKVETRPPESVPMEEEMQIGQLANYVTQYKWVNTKTGDTIDFRSDGTFSGKIDGEDYSGKFNLSKDKKKLGRVNSEVTLDGAKEAVKFTFDFKTSAEMTLTTDKGKSESYVAEWAVK